VRIRQKDPWISHRRPADHDGVAARSPAQPLRILDRRDVAVPEDGDCDGGLDLADGGPIGLSRVSLDFGPPVDGNEGAAIVLNRPGHFQIVERVVIPPQPDLGGYGNRQGAGERADDASDLGRSAATRRLRRGRRRTRRAAHVDVDDVGLKIHQAQRAASRRLRCHRRSGRHRPLGRVERQGALACGESARMAAALTKRCNSSPTRTATQGAERQVRESVHRRQEAAEIGIGPMWKDGVSMTGKDNMRPRSSTRMAAMEWGQIGNGWAVDLLRRQLTRGRRITPT
jgi:hypothetical protein